MNFLYLESNIPEKEWKQIINDSQTATSTSIEENDEHYDENLWQKSNDLDHLSESLSNNNTNNNNNLASKLGKLNQVKIETLSKELINLQKRYSELFTEYKNIQRKAISYYNQNVTNEKNLKDLRSKELDLNVSMKNLSYLFLILLIFQASIQAKDTQIAALKVQMEQIDSELVQKNEKIFHLEQMNSELQCLVNQKPALDQEIVSNLEHEIANLKQALNDEHDELKRIQNTHREQVNRLEDNQRSLIDEIENCRRELVEIKNAKAKAEFVSTSLQKRLDSLEVEYSEFKLKANKTLQDKDEMIRSLRYEQQEGNEELLDEPHHSGLFSNVSGDRLRVLQEQYDSLVKELNDLQAKYAAAKLAVEKVRLG